MKTFPGKESILRSNAREHKGWFKDPHRERTRFKWHAKKAWRAGLKRLLRKEHHEAQD